MRLEFFNNVEDIVKVQRLNPMLMSNIIGLYQEGKYNDVIDAIASYVDETKSIDACILFMAFASDLYLEITDVTLLADRLKIYHDILNNVSDKLSPIDNFHITLGRGVDFFAQMVELKCSAGRKEIKLFDIAPLENIYQNFNNSVKLLASTELDIDSRKSVKAANKSIADLKAVLQQLNIKTAEANKSEPKAAGQTAAPPSTEEVSQTTNHQRHRYVDDFASIKWYKLIRKIAILCNMINKKRFFEAAIIYEDVQQELMHFDPKDYFPGLFFPLFQTLAPSAKKLYQYMEQNSNTLEWHIAKKLYRADPVRFLRDLPLMMENHYSEEQFHQGSYQEEESGDENRKLMDDVDRFSDSDHVSFRQSDTMDESAEEELGDEELNGLLSEIESAWDDAGLSKK